VDSLAQMDNKSTRGRKFPAFREPARRHVVGIEAK